MKHAMFVLVIAVGAIVVGCEDNRIRLGPLGGKSGGDVEMGPGLELDGHTRIHDQRAGGQAGVAADNVGGVRERPVRIRDRAADVGLS